MKKIIFAFSAMSLFATPTFAGSGAALPANRGGASVTATTVPAPQADINGNYVPTAISNTGATNAPTVQQAGQASSKSNGSGQMLGGIAMGVTGMGVASTCFMVPVAAACPYWVAGLAASTVVTMNMGQAKQKSNATVAAVTVGGSTGGSDSSTPNYTETPEFKKAETTLKKLKDMGYKIDMKNGNVTDPSGKSYNAGTFSSAGSMAAAGMSPLQISDSLAAAKKLSSELDKKSKGADGSSDMFGDGSSGGGGAPQAGVGAGAGDMNGANIGFAAGAGKLEVDRDPAQVAGLTKNLDGTPIGVSQDNLFTMIGKRYQWCSSKGCFLPPAKH